MVRSLFDPVTISAAVATASTAFNGIKRAFQAGRDLEAMSQDDYFSGNPSSKKPEGFNCSFETNFRQSRICQAIDKFAGDNT